MNTDKITNPVVKKAIDALQAGDETSWLSLFIADATITDDGTPRDFKKFTADVIGHERFTSIDKVENGGKTVYGHFHSEQWGDFKTFFKFHLNAADKINRLEMGQTD